MDNYLIVVGILEGRNFDLTNQTKNDDGCPCHSPNHDVFFEARFLDDVLESDPIPLKTASPSIFAELAWEVSRKSLHDFRIERKPIKLQAFACGVDNCKHLIGYSVFDIRSAQETVCPKYEWKPLLNPQYKGISCERPEIMCALRLIKSEEDPLKHKTKENILPVVETNGHHEDDLLMKEVDGVIHIWDRKSKEADCKQLFELSIVVASARNLNLLRPKRVTDVEDYFFAFNILDTTIQTSKFGDLISCHFDVEKIAFKLAVPSLHVIESYLKLNPSMDIQFKRIHRRTNATDVVGFTSVYVRNLVVKGVIKGISKEYSLYPTDEDIILTDPLPTVKICIDLVTISPSRHLPPAKATLSTNICHYSMTIDVRSIESLSPSLNGQFYLQYLYPIFGSVEITQTNSVSGLPCHQEIIFEEGVMSFNFPSSMDKMSKSFKKIPLLIELVEESAISGKAIIRGIGKVDLSQIFSQLPDYERKRILVMTSVVKDASNVDLARVKLILCLQERESLKSCMASTCATSSNNKHSSTERSADGSETLRHLLVEAAIEIEVWKEQQKKKFKERLNVQYPTSLDDKKNNNQLLPIDVKALEDELIESLARVKEQERSLHKLKTEYHERLDRLDDEISEAIQQVKIVYEDKLEKERNERKRLEGLLESSSPKNRISLNGSTSNVRSSLTFRSSSLSRTNQPISNSARSLSITRPTAKNSSSEPNTTASLGVTTSLRARTPSIGPRRPSIASSKTSSASGSTTSVTNVAASSKNPETKRKNLVLKELQSERDVVLKKGLLRSDDPLIKNIEKELRRNGLTMK